MGAKRAVEIVFRGTILRKSRPSTPREYEERFANPFVAASKGFIDEVIMPHSTRRRVAMGLRKLRNKQLENPWKKHDNIPLLEADFVGIAAPYRSRSRSVLSLTALAALFVTVDAARVYLPILFPPGC